MAAGTLDEVKPRQARLILAAMAIATIVITAVAAIALARKGVMQMAADHHTSHAAPAQQLAMRS